MTDHTSSAFEITEAHELVQALVTTLGIARVQIEASNLYVGNDAIREGGELLIAEIDRVLALSKAAA